MYRITVESVDWDKVVGVRAVIPVKVDWPELRLTEEQVLANAIALADGAEAPHPDRTYIEVVVERPRSR